MGMRFRPHSLYYLNSLYFPVFYICLARSITLFFYLTHCITFQSLLYENHMQITTILAFITAFGGLEAVKWLVRYINCRQTDARKEEASADSLEEENRRKKVDWLEERLAQRDEKIDGLYAELHKEQAEKIDWIHKCHEVELAQKESEIKKCEIRGCVKRIPPSVY